MGIGKLNYVDEDSSYLCTFTTPFGQYCFTHMPFGLKSASEVLQKKNQAAFEGIQGIQIMADDIITAASTVEERDIILHQVLQRAMGQNIKWNFDKLQLRMCKSRKTFGNLHAPNFTNAFMVSSQRYKQITNHLR